MALFAWGCAGGGAPAASSAPDTRVLLVANLNAVVPLPDEMEPVAPIAAKELRLALAARSNPIKTLPGDTWRRRWRESSQRIQQRAAQGTAALGFDDAAAELARSLAPEEPFDLLLLPSLVSRDAEIVKRRARWDDISRPLEYEVEGLRARNVASSYPLQGTIPAVSLHLAVFDARGRKVAERLGGLALMRRVQVTGGSGEDVEPAVELVPHPDPFADRPGLRARLDEELARALAGAD